MRFAWSIEGRRQPANSRCTLQTRLFQPSEDAGEQAAASDRANDPCEIRDAVLVELVLELVHQRRVALDDDRRIKRGHVHAASSQYLVDQLRAGTTSSAADGRAGSPSFRFSDQGARRSIRLGPVGTALDHLASVASKAVDHRPLSCNGDADRRFDAERPSRVGAGKAGVAARGADEVCSIAKGLERSLSEEADTSAVRRRRGRMISGRSGGGEGRRASVGELNKDRPVLERP